MGGHEEPEKFGPRFASIDITMTTRASITEGNEHKRSASYAADVDPAVSLGLALQNNDQALLQAISNDSL